MGGLYSVLIIVCYIGCFLCIQSNTITRSLISLFSFSPYVIGVCISVVTFFCIYGGFKSIVGVCKLAVKILDGSIGVDKVSGESVVDGITPCESSIVVVDGAGAVSVLPAALFLAELP